MNNSEIPRTRLYGRRKGRPLHMRKARLMRELLPKFEITLAVNEKLDPFGLFTPPAEKMWLEIGFGGGEHLAAQALRHPSFGFIGCEPFVNGIAGLLDHIDRESIGNIRIFPDDARRLCDVLPSASIERCYILFADPWPKAKHAERRFIGSENLLRLARILKPQGQLYLATDDTRLADWMFLQMQNCADFEETYNASDPPADWLPTRYEQKAIKAGRPPVYRIYHRV